MTEGILLLFGQHSRARLVRSLQDLSPGSTHVDLLELRGAAAAALLRRCIGSIVPLHGDSAAAVLELGS